MASPFSRNKRNVGANANGKLTHNELRKPHAVKCSDHNALRQRLEGRRSRNPDLTLGRGFQLTSLHLLFPAVGPGPELRTAVPAPDADARYAQLRVFYGWSRNGRAKDRLRDVEVIGFWR